MSVNSQAVESTNETPVEFITIREQYQLELITEYYDAYYWRPRLQTDEYRIGHVCLNQTDQMPTKDDLKGLSAAPLVVRSTGLNEVLKAPTSWKRLFPKESQKPNKGQLCIYRPECDDDFAALSDVAVIHDGSDEASFNPDPHFRCVHKALLRYSELIAHEIWTDVESTWNIQGSGFFMWAPTSQFPEDLHPYVLNSGTIMSNLQLVEMDYTPSSQVELIPQFLFKSNFDNISDHRMTHNFEAIRTQSSSVSGTWSNTNSTEIGLKFGVQIATVVRVELLLSEITQSTTLSFENMINHLESHTVGGGTTELQTTTFRQECTVDIPPRTNVEVSAVIYKAKYDVTYVGKLRLHSGAPGAKPIDIRVSGKFAHQIDTEETWWTVKNGEFVEKKKLPH
jgi:Clostridium epsilon toxin ETX/Bacillus mosquitocidal toxin MTX2.